MNHHSIPRLIRSCLVAAGAWLAITLVAPDLAFAQTIGRDHEIAARFAPIFYQALGDKPRSDYITNFDFDGDWRGDNNWENVDNHKFPLRAYVYYSLSETQTHFFIHYAVFHPRDYKGGEKKGRILSELIREGVKRGTKEDPTGLVAEAGVAHENDLEGALIVVQKKGEDLDQSRLAFVETLHHNDFSRYLPGEAPPKGFGLFRTEEHRVLLYIEPKGHGIEAYRDDEKQKAGKQFLIYRFNGKAEEPGEQRDSAVGYELLPIQTTLWLKAQLKTANANISYGNTHNYGEVAIKLVQADGRVAMKKIEVGKIGSAFVGDTGGANMAKPPWAWFNKNSRNQPLGMWFFDPAAIIKRDFRLDDSFSTAYVRLPFWANEL